MRRAGLGGVGEPGHAEKGAAEEEVRVADNVGASSERPLLQCAAFILACPPGRSARWDWVSGVTL